MVQASTPVPSATRTLKPLVVRPASVRRRKTGIPAHLLAGESPLPRIAMVSTHGYVAANPPLGAADTGGQVVYVLELSKKLALLGYQVDIWTGEFEEQPEIEPVAERVRIIRMPCGGKDFLPKEYLCNHLAEWNEPALRFIERHGLTYSFINSHYWDAGIGGLGTELHDVRTGRMDHFSGFAHGWDTGRVSASEQTVRRNPLPFSP